MLPHVLISLLTTAALAGTLKPGQALDEALAIHLTNAGLASVGDGIEGLVPREIPISDIGGELECDEGDASPLSYYLDAMDINIGVQEVELLASDGRLDLTLYLTLSSSYGELTVDGDCTILTDLDEVCGIELPTTAATFHMGMTMAIFGENILVDVDDLSLWISPIGNPMSDCTLSSAVGTLLGQDPDFLSNLITGLVNPELEGLDVDIEEAIVDGLGQLYIDTDLSLGEADLQLSLYPSILQLDESGLLLGLGVQSYMTALSDCVPASGGSETHAPGWPDISETAWGGALEYDAGIFLNGDFVDHLLWEVWASGLLCQDVGALAAEQGITINTDFLATLFGDELTALFPENSPATLRTWSPVAPTVMFDDDIPIALDLSEFGIETIADLDGRKVRLNKIGFADDFGLDPGITSAAIAPALLVDLLNLRFSEPVNEYMSPGFSDGVADFVPTILEQFGLADTLDTLIPSFAIPDLYGMGIETVFWIPDETAQWQGGFLLLDVDEVEPIALEGCSGGSIPGCGTDTGGEDVSFEDLLGCGTEDDLLGCGSEDSAGCGDSGCSSEDGSSGCEDSGCATHNGRRRIWLGSRMLVIWAVFIGVSVRRRRS